MVININLVKSDRGTPFTPFVKRMIQTLGIQGQIEPLQVRRREGMGYITFPQDAWGAEILEAAKQLGWPTILIVEVEKYQE